MILIQDVYSDYLNASSSHPRVPGQSKDPSLAALRKGIPEYLANLIASSGRETVEYRCYGGYGQTNFHFAKVPWVAACRKSIATTVKSGYFVVLLFSEDMSGCWLSLNQGFTQYHKAFGDNNVARRQAGVGASILAKMLPQSHSFDSGPIDLRAKTDLGKGYEAGAILSRHYAATAAPTEAAFATDFLDLLGIFDRLSQHAGENVVALLPDTDGPYQSAISSRSRNKSAKDIPGGPREPRGGQTSSNKGGWRRDPKMAVRALELADFKCEIDEAHSTFVARSTKRNFVEAHHLIPIAEQSNHKFSLDVPENIVAL